MSEYNLTHLKQLEAESIHIIREVAAEFEKPVMLYVPLSFFLFWPLSCCKKIGVGNALQTLFGPPHLGDCVIGFCLHNKEG